jgi:hypothetical protein
LSISFVNLILLQINVDAGLQKAAVILLGITNNDVYVAGDARVMHGPLIADRLFFCGQVSFPTGYSHKI